MHTLRPRRSHGNIQSSRQHIGLDTSTSNPHRWAIPWRVLQRYIHARRSRPMAREGCLERQRSESANVLTGRGTQRGNAWKAFGYAGGPLCHDCSCSRGRCHDLGDVAEKALAQEPCVVGLTGIEAFPFFIFQVSYAPLVFDRAEELR